MSAYTDKKELIAKVMQLTELTNDEKSRLVKSLNEEKRYGLVWEEKHEDVETRLAENIPVLQEVKERAIQSDSADAPNHVLIEGDNLEALTALSYTHKGRIDVIYIDPPYNTGNKDFVYNDAYVDKEDKFFHSKWLSFMYKRLKLAKELLTDKGVIFISIDENEIAQLRIISDEIFGGKNFVGQWNWYKSETPPALSKKIKRNIEYVLCWKRENNDEKFKGVKKISSSNDPFTKPQNSYKELLFPSQSITCKFPDGLYSAGTYGTAKFPNELLDDLIVENGKNMNPVRFRNRFIWVQDTLNNNLENGLYVELSKSLVLSYKRENYSPEVPPNLIDSSVGVVTTEKAGKQLSDMFNGLQPFSFPKPVSLIQYLLNFTYNTNITILDFFAGSGTTLHATMQLNAEDGGKRKCILVTNNENKICEDVTYVRNKKVIEGYTTQKGEKVEGLKKNNLRYYKMDYVPQENISVNMRELMEKATDMLCIKHDIYKEVPLCDKPIRKSVLRYFEEGDKRMLMIYEEEYVEEIVKVLATKPVGTKPIMTYVFSSTNYAYDEDFSDVSDRVELCALPKAIYNSYKHVKDVLKIEKIEADDSEIADESTEEGGEA